MKVLLIAPGHPDLTAGTAARIASDLFEGLRALDGMRPVLLASVDRSIPALFKPGAHITAFDGPPDQYLLLSHDLDPWWHRNREPLLVEAFAEFLRAVVPDVVHFHDIMTAGAELLSLTRRVLPGCRIVMTLHELGAICAAGGTMRRLTDGTPCAHASPVRCHLCFPDIPPEDFFLRTLWFQTHLAVVDCFTVASEAMREQFVTWGLERDRLLVLPFAAAGKAARGKRVAGTPLLEPASVRRFASLYAVPACTPPP